jgi:hypothetical protein
MNRIVIPSFWFRFCERDGFDRLRPRSNCTTNETLRNGHVPTSCDDIGKFAVLENNRT